MMLTYGLTIIIAGAFLIKNIGSGKLTIHRTPFDIPILLFFISQVISTIFSIDRHTSLIGYYSRFHGGLYSTIAYLILFYIFVNEFWGNKDFVFKSLNTLFLSGFLVAGYALLERFGIDKNIWVQDVQNRVFSSLGQPNWLAAYLAVLILLSLPLFLTNSKTKKYLYLFLAIFWYTIIIFTKSRSGFTGFWVGFCAFALISFSTISYLVFGLLFELSSLIVYLMNINLLPSFGKIVNQVIYALALINLPPLIFVFWKKSKKAVRDTTHVNTLKSLGFAFLLILLVSFIFGVPFSQFEPFTLTGLRQKLRAGKTVASPSPAPSGSTIEYGGTESGAIRKIVWTGALEIIKHYPVFGTGVETFAYSYYRFRPQTHNLTSEWDFLYNKAHNEYLNFAANSGFFGLGTYLLLIVVYLVWAIKTLLKKPPETLPLAGLLAAYLSILVSNFFGFSVVIIGLFFFLIPAFSLILVDNKIKQKEVNIRLFQDRFNLNDLQKGIILFLLFVICYLLFTLIQMWRADKLFSRGHQLIRTGEDVTAYGFLKQATVLNPSEPFFKDELSLSSATLALYAKEQKDEELYNRLKTEATSLSDELITRYPNNINYWKTRTKVYYTLSQLDPQMTKISLEAILKAWELAPNDPKIAYNAGLLYAKVDQNDSAIKSLQKSVQLKPDYYEPYWALVLFYEQLGEKDKEKETLNTILTKVRPGDTQAKEKLDKL